MYNLRDETQAPGAKALKMPTILMGDDCEGRQC